MTMADPVFLDHASATPLRPEVADAMARAAGDAWANPSSQHAAGRRAKQVLEECRERILALVGARSTGSRRDRLVFTSGMTEANRLAILGMAAGHSGCIASSARDHSSVRGTVRELGDRGWRVFEPPLDGRAAIAVGWSFPADAPGPRILCLTLVCGQTGTVEPRIANPANDGANAVFLHADAAQAPLCHRVSFSEAGFATLAIAPCKFGGPRGIGATIVRAGIPFAGLVPGPQESGLRGGTEAVLLAAGFARALEIVVAERAAVAERIGRLRDRLEAGIVAAARTAGIPARVVADAGHRATNLLVVTFPGIDRQAFVMAADLQGVACASGTACASGSSEPAPALAALGLETEPARSAVRFSFGTSSSATDVDRAVTRLEQVFTRLKPHPGS
ncbi:MAG: cysteine desulfurase family protein [Planctomycetia bacterium]|jgi:cysteine desulfurase